MEGFGEVIDVGNNTDSAGFVGKCDGRFDFGKHGAGLEIAFFDEFVELFGGDSVDGLSIWLAIIDVGIRDSCNRNEDVGFNFFGEAFGGEIFVDDSVDTLETFHDFGAINWNTATASGDNDNAIFD